MGRGRRRVCRRRVVELVGSWVSAGEREVREVREVRGLCRTFGEQL